MLRAKGSSLPTGRDGAKALGHALSNSVEWVDVGKDRNGTKLWTCIPVCNLVPQKVSPTGKVGKKWLELGGKCAPGGTVEIEGDDDAPDDDTPGYIKDDPQDSIPF